MCSGARRTRRGIVVALAAIAIAACADRDPVMPGSPEEETPRLDRTIGVVEVTISGIGGEQPSSSVLSAASVAELATLRATEPHAIGGGASRALLPPAATVGGDGTIQLEQVSTGSFTEGDRANGGVRYVWANYRVRNAQKDKTPYDTERKNLTFLAVATDGTLGETAISHLRLFDNNNANAAIAVQILPTGAVTRDLLTNDIVSAGPDALQVLSEQEAAEVDRPAGVRDVFPYGFVVRRAGDATTHTLPASPAADQFDGVVTFAFKIPLQGLAKDDPFTISFMAMAVDDDETRITQSLEEQDAAGQAAFEARAVALSATTLTLLPGSDYAGGSSRLVCTARTAGSAASPVATIGVSTPLLSLSPTAGPISPTAQFTATFGRPVSGFGPDNFIVRGLQSGREFRGATYTGNGTASITTPAASFFPGEEVEVVLKDDAPCMDGLPHVARRIVASGSASGTFEGYQSFYAGEWPTRPMAADWNGDGLPDLGAPNRMSHTLTTYILAAPISKSTWHTTSLGPKPYSNQVPEIKAAAGDLNGDGHLDVVVASGEEGLVLVHLGNGNGTFTAGPRIAVGSNPKAIALADLNGDGALDFAVANRSSQSVAIGLGNGDGTFQPVVNYGVGAYSEDVVLADLDGDGRLDMIIATLSFFQVRLGNGDGTFGPARSIGGLASSKTLAVADLDGDGILDIMVGEHTGSNGRLSTYLGRGDGVTFALHSRTLVGSDSPLNGVITADLDGNGTMDVAASMWYPGSVWVLLNDGTATFSTHEYSAPYAEGLTVADWDGDGKLDIAYSEGIYGGPAGLTSIVVLWGQ